MKQIIDQSAHFAAAFIVALLCAASPFAGALLGLSLGLVREFTEWQAKPDRGRFPWAGPGSVLSPGSRLDFVFWALGGAVGGLA